MHNFDSNIFLFCTKIFIWSSNFRTILFKVYSFYLRYTSNVTKNKQNIYCYICTHYKLVFVTFVYNTAAFREITDCRDFIGTVSTCWSLFGVLSSLFGKNSPDSDRHPENFLFLFCFLYFYSRTVICCALNYLIEISISADFSSNKSPLRLSAAMDSLEYSRPLSS